MWHSHFSIRRDDHNFGGQYNNLNNHDIVNLDNYDDHACADSNLR